jgi:hypothetical protein
VLLERAAQLAQQTLPRAWRSSRLSKARRAMQVGHRLVMMPNSQACKPTTIWRDDEEVQACGPGENIKMRLSGIDDSEARCYIVLSCSARPLCAYVRLRMLPADAPSVIRCSTRSGHVEVWRRDSARARLSAERSVRVAPRVAAHARACQVMNAVQHTSVVNVSVRLQLLSSCWFAQPCAVHRG